MANTFRTDEYRSTSTLTNVVSTLFGILIVCQVLLVVFGFGLAVAPDSAIDLGDGASLQVFLIEIGLAGILELGLRLAIIVVFLVWLHRSYSNLCALGARNLDTSPGWAVGWWFIPFANLVKPYQVVKETWVESEPDFDAELGYTIASVERPIELPLWWGCWLISNIVGRVAERTIDAPDGTVSSAYAPLLIASSGLAIAASVLLIMIVRGINARQEARRERIGTLDPSGPPPPPTFENAAPAMGS